MVLATVARAQPPQLPNGYHLLEDAPDPCLVRADLDGDKKTDLFCAAKRKNETDARLVAVLKDGKSVIVSGMLSMCCGSLAVHGNVVDVHSQGMRGFSYYKFRWDAAAKDFRLIGYDTESFGNAVHDGSGTTSLNMLTGNYEANTNTWDEKKEDLIPHKVKRKLSLSRKVYLKNFDKKVCDWLSDIDYKNLPKELR
jgi:hypothetical protein